YKHTLSLSVSLPHTHTLTHSHTLTHTPNRASNLTLTVRAQYTAMPPASSAYAERQWTRIITAWLSISSHCPANWLCDRQVLVIGCNCLCNCTLGNRGHTHTHYTHTHTTHTHSH